MLFFLEPCIHDFHSVQNNCIHVFHAFIAKFPLRN
uniref:Uncharacterized protein n=1 Tax=Rhizophora mucronata TaxID=61149 RepID=A0A2P2QLN2_RHIMU